MFEKNRLLVKRTCDFQKENSHNSLYLPLTMGAVLNGMPFKYLTICHLHMTVPAHRLLQFLVAMSHVNERKGGGVPLIMQALFLNASFWVV